MSNDYTDLTDLLAELVEKYYATGNLLDLDSWETDDLLIMAAIIQQALELRLDDNELDRVREMASREEDEADLLPYEEYLDLGENDVIRDESEDRADIEADYEDPLFVG